MSNRRFPFLIAGLCSCVAVVVAAQSVRLITRTFGPKTDVRISKPTLVWEAWPEGEDRITKVNVSLDGKKVDAKYDSKSKRVRIEPNATLQPGTHRVEMEIFVNNWAKFKKEWSFRILPGALEVIPEPDEASRKVVEISNEIRKKAQLEPFTIDSRLSMSAKLHSEYMAENDAGDHIQYPSRPKFTAETPSERMEQFGFSDGSWEILAPGIEEPEIGLQRLFDAPYHRVSFMQPGKLLVGGGFVKGCLVVDGQATSETRTVVSPSPNQEDIPILWKDRESPDPMRLHRTGGEPTGYPIVFSHYTPEMERIEFISATVTDEDGKELPLLINSPKNDEHLTHAVFILARDPFENAKKYRVEVQAKDSKGRDISRSWSFKTEN